MPTTVENKTALVTGANRGIGKALVETFLKHGARKVYAAVRDPKSAEALVAVHGDRVVPLRLDLADAESIHAAAAAASDVEIVVNNGGVLTTTGPLDDAVFDSLEYEMEVNVRGLLRVARAFAPVLKANGGGALAQVNSVVSLKSFAAFSTYSASKAAAYSLTQALRETLAGQSTEVYSIHPGPISTDMGAAAGLEDIAEPPSLVGEALVEAMAKGEFHVFPDSMAQQIGEAYAGFAAGVIEAAGGEG